MAIFHKYPYTDIHDLNLDWILKTVKAMKEKFDSIDFDSIFTQLESLNEITSQHTELITGIQSDITQIGLDIASINQALETQSGSISDIQTTINGMSDQISSIITSITTAQEDIRDLKDDVADINTSMDTISGSVDQIEQDFTSMDARVTALEAATIGQLQPSTVPKNLCIDLTQGYDDMDVEIVKDETGKARDSITYDGTNSEIAKRGFSFDYNVTDFNACHLRFHNVCAQEMTQDSANYVPTYTIAWLSDRYTNLYGYSQGRPFATIRTLAQLLEGVTLDPSDYQIAFIQMVDSATHPGVYYDLLIYPQYNGVYATYNTRFRELYVFNSSGILVEGVQGTYSKRWMLQKYKPAWVPEIISLIRSNGADTTQIESDISQLQTDVSTLDTQINGESSSSITNQIQQLGVDISTTDTALSIVSGELDTLENFVGRYDFYTTDPDDVLSNIPTGLNFVQFEMMCANGFTWIYALMTGVQFTAENNLKIGDIRSAVQKYFRTRGDIHYYEGVSFWVNSEGHISPAIYGVGNQATHGTVMINCELDGSSQNPLRPDYPIGNNTIRIVDDGNAPTTRNAFLFNIVFGNRPSGNQNS